MLKLLERLKSRRHLAGRQSGSLILAILILSWDQQLSGVEASVTDSLQFVDPEVHVTRASLIARGLKHHNADQAAMSKRHLLHTTESEDRADLAELNSSHSLRPVNKQPSTQPVEEQDVTQPVEEQPTRQNLDQNSTQIPQKAQPAEQAGANHEPEEWIQHFQRRRLQQFGGGVAVSPTGGPRSRLLRRANRNIPTAAPAGSVGIQQPTLYSFLQQNGSADAFSAVSLRGADDSDQAPCHTLAYQSGYASLKVDPYTSFRFTANKEQCCELCEEDDSCAAWSRVAGGQATVRTCYLMSSLNVSGDSSKQIGAAAAPAYLAANTVQTQSISPASSSQQALSSQALPPLPTFEAPSPATLPEAPAAAPDVFFESRQGPSPVAFIGIESPLIIESGTKTGVQLPAQYYGCPYPPSSSGKCTPPPYCNCYDEVCYGSCEGNELLDDFGAFGG